jgi:hypothetical protein
MGKKASLAQTKKSDESIEQTPPPEMLGLEQFDTGDLVIPRFKIVQPTSKEGTPGRFKNNLTNEEIDKLSVVVLAASKGRVCWSENLEEDPICRSGDGLLPSDNVESPVNSICGTKENGKRFEAVCPNAKWGDNNERPLCNEVINLLCVSKDDHVPFFISVHGTQLKPVRAYLSALGLRKKSLYEYQATMSLKETSNQKGKFFVVQFEDLKESKPDQKEIFRAMFFQYSGHSIDQTFEAEQKMKEDGLEDVPFA